MFTMPRLVASAIALSAAMPANALVLTFDALSPGASTTATRGSNGQIVEQGFRVSSSLCNDPSPSFSIGRCFTSVQRLGAAAPQRSIDRSTTSAAIRTVFQGQNITVEQVNGGAFTFGGVDIKSDYGSNLTNVDFVYTLLDGTTGSSRFALPTLNQDPDGSTYSLTGVGPISRLVFDPVERNGAFQFDNIQVTPFVAPIPEPATWAMMIAGFGLAGAALRRRPATRLA